MKDDAVINGEVVRLSTEERIAGENFHLNRLPFAWVKGVLTFNENPDDDRDHQHWLLEDLGIPVEEWETTPRGYIKEGRIQFLIGSRFRPITAQDMPNVSKADFQRILNKHWAMFPAEKGCHVYNGVRVGKIGELWPPIQHCGYYWRQDK